MNVPFKYTENVTTKKEKFQIKKILMFFFIDISAQNIDCGYSLEPPRQGGSNEYPQSIFWAEINKCNVYPCKLVLLCKKVGLKWVKTIWACFRDESSMFLNLILKNHQYLKENKWSQLDSHISCSLKYAQKLSVIETCYCAEAIC